MSPHSAFLAFLTLLVPAGSASAGVESALVRLARDAVRAAVEGRPAPRPQSKSAPLPVFVTIERAGKVVGCRGTLECRSASVEEEVLLAARSAARHDPRYAPLRPGDLDGFQVTVTLVRALRAVDGVEGLTPAQGLVLKAGSRTGVVLPWEGKDPATRLRWAYRKAGVPEGSPCRLYVMTAERVRG